jgi:antitoxin component of RelBE/YafQ-DinJ toxin-antitoxin module
MTPAQARAQARYQKKNLKSRRAAVMTLWLGSDVKAAAIAACEARGCKMSTVVRKLLQRWILTGKI